MKSNGIQAIFGLTLVGALCMGCASDPANANRNRGAAGGAALGAGVGYLAGSNIKGLSKTEGMVAGAAIGGLMGGSRGKQTDRANRQQSEIDDMRAQMNTATVNVTNNNGSITPVVLRSAGTNQWQGPRGEIYNGLPTGEMLKPVYGL